MACIAACGGTQSSGAFVSVKGGGIAIDSVSLYLGQGACVRPDGSMCQIAPKNVSKRLAGDIFVRDDSGNAKPFAEPARQGTAKFQIESPSSDETLQLVAVGELNGKAVAYGIANDVTIPAHGAIEVTIELAAAGEANDNEENVSPHPDGDFIAEWNSPALCVVAEHWSGGTVDRTMVVPNEDPDCDGLLATDASGQKNALECDPYFFDYTSPFSRFSQSTCATQNFTVSGLHTCVLGGPPCTDGVGPDNTMCAGVTAPVCVPSLICGSQCASINSTVPLSGCAYESGGGTFVHCVIYSDPAGGGCQAPSLARPLTGHIDLSPLLGSNVSRSCTDYLFSRTNSLTNIQLDNQFDLSPASNARFQLGDKATPCGLDILWDGAQLASAMFLDTPEFALIKVAIDNGNYALIPLELTASSCINLQPSQADGIYCTFTIGSPNGVADTITNCGL